MFQEKYISTIKTLVLYNNQSTKPKLVLPSPSLFHVFYIAVGLQVQVATGLPLATGLQIQVATGL